MRRPGWAFATTMCVLAVFAAPARATTPAVLTLVARNDADQPAVALHAGETVVVSGTVTPAVVGEPVVVFVALGGRPLPVRTASVDAVDAHGVGTFRAMVRPMG